VAIFECVYEKVKDQLNRHNLLHPFVSSRPLLALMSDVEEQIRLEQEQRRRAQLAKKSAPADESAVDTVGSGKAKKYEGYDTSIAVHGDGDVDTEDVEVRQLDSCELSRMFSSSDGAVLIGLGPDCFRFR
jgi:hypothetical protein